MTDKIDGRNISSFKGGLSIIQDFYLEFFGTLLPGVIAVTASILLGLGFYYFLTADTSFIKESCRLVFGNWEVGLLYLALSYVMGAIAYRRNPKTPDTISAYRQWKATKEGASSEEVGRLSVSFDASRVIPHGLFNHILYWWNREQWILRRAGHNIDYPYPHMRQYLCCRGLAHLADYVPWCAGSGGSAFKESFEKGKCSKHYVNIIKQRLRNSGRGTLILDMVRNECNIRMLSSLWYILTFVRRILMGAVIVAALAVPVKTYLYSVLEEPPKTIGVEVLTSVSNNAEVVASEYKTQTRVVDCHIVDDRGIEQEAWTLFFPKERDSIIRIIWFFFLTFLAVGLVIYCQNSVESGFHYVRTREVTMILETAWILDTVEHGGDRYRPSVQQTQELFKDIKELAREFKRGHCSICKHCKICYGTEVLS